MQQAMAAGSLSLDDVRSPRSGAAQNDMDSTPLRQVGAGGRTPELTPRVRSMADEADDLFSDDD